MSAGAWPTRAARLAELRRLKTRARDRAALAMEDGEHYRVQALMDQVREATAEQRRVLAEVEQ